VAAVQASNGLDAADQTRALKGKADIAVWPEILLRAESNHPPSSAKSAHIYVAADFVEPNPGHKPYNSVFFFDPSGKRIAVFRKQNLFGTEKLGIAPGNMTDPIRTAHFCAGIPICYDTEFTGIVRNMVRRGADIILVPNHDPELPNYIFHYLHSAVIPFRAAENGVPVVWSESQSLSAIYDFDGKILARAPKSCVTAITAKVRLRSRNTIFTRIGDLFAYLCTGAALVMLLLLLRVGSKR
jgi:apolipoprotein N-acyltransferase